MTKRILLTGAAGFVGSHVLRHLLVNTDWHIICPVTFRHKGISDRLVTAMSGLDQSRVDIIQTDLTAPVSAQTAYKFGDINYILNVASESNVDLSISDPAPFIQNNVALIINILEYARTLNNLEVFLQVSTDETFGPAPVGTSHTEWVDIPKPSNPYSASKAAQEAIVFSYWRTFGLPIVVSNTMNIIGETQDPSKYFPMVMKKVRDNESVSIHASKDGVIGSRFYLHARNQADGLLYLLRYFSANSCPLNWFDETSGVVESLYYKNNGTVHPRFNIVGEKEVDNLTLANLIAKNVGKNLKYELTDFHSSRPGHDLRYSLSGEKMKKLGWVAPISLEESISTIVSWTLEHPEWLLK